MSAIRFLGISLLSACLYAQIAAQPGVSPTRNPSSNAPSPYSSPLLTPSGDLSLIDGTPQMQPDGPRVSIVSERAYRTSTPVVSLHELQHPIPEKAIRDAYQAQELVRVHKIGKAIRKLEQAIKIAPLYRDAHLNLGVEYARTGRISEAEAQFQKALEIGPPIAPIYADLAMSHLALHQYPEAGTAALQALKMDPSNAGAKRILQYVSRQRPQASENSAP